MINKRKQQKPFFMFMEGLLTCPQLTKGSSGMLESKTRWKVQVCKPGKCAFTLGTTAIFNVRQAYFYYLQSCFLIKAHTDINCELLMVVVGGIQTSTLHAYQLKRKEPLFIKFKKHSLISC